MKKADRVRDSKKKGTEAGRRLYLSILLVLLAAISITAATAAWFTIADFSRVRSLGLEIHSGSNLRFDLDPHSQLSDYVKPLSFAKISQRIKRDQGFDMKDTFLEPVTTRDCKSFSLEDGTVVQAETGAYLEFVLHFMAGEDMIVHLTSENSGDGNDGTRVTSEDPQLVDAMRISFTSDGKTVVYQPGNAKGDSLQNGIRSFGLPSADRMVYTDENALFSLKENQNLPVTVRVWLEGTDAACTDALRGAEYSIQLRFEGTDENNISLDGRELNNRE